MHIFAIVFILSFAALFLGAMTLSLFRRCEESAGRRLLETAFTLLAMYGAFAFFAQALSSCGGLWFLGPSIEWPVGYSLSVIRDSHGQFIVPIASAGRVQVYDARGRFLRGWFIDTGGGTLKLDLTADDRIGVFTARGRRHLVFSSDGTLLEQNSYAPQSFSDLPESPSLARTFSTPWLLWPFSSPFIAWGLLVVGLLGMRCVDRGANRKR
jgi:hypothetical protein